MKNRITALLLLCVLLLSLVSCASNEEEANAPVQTVNKVEINTDPMLDEAVAAMNATPSANLSENGFTVVSTSDMKFVPSGDNTKYDSAVGMRNKLFETKFQATITQVYSDTESAINDAKKNMLAGLYYCDIFAIEEKDLGTFAANNILLNLPSLSKTDFDGDYYDSVAMNQATVISDRYGIYGSFNKDIDSYYCLYINRARLSEANLEMPYSKVADGSWSWDEMLNIAKSVSDINTDVRTLCAASPEVLGGVCLNSSGQCSVSSEYEKSPTLAYSNSATDKVLQILASFSAGFTDKNEFKSGEYLYCVATVGDMRDITTMSDDWCVLPIPKAIAEQKNYYTPTSADHTVICVYAGVSDTDNICYAINGLYAASSGDYLTQNYYNELINTSIRDSSTLEMMDYISGIKGGKAVTDFSNIYQFYLPTFTAIYWGRGKASAEIYEENAELFSLGVGNLY